MITVSLLWIGIGLLFSFIIGSLITNYIIQLIKKRDDVIYSNVRYVDFRHKSL